MDEQKDDGTISVQIIDDRKSIKKIISEEMKASDENQRLSKKSEKAVDLLLSVERKIMEVEIFVFKSEEMDKYNFHARSTEELVTLKNKLNDMSGAIDQLQYKGVDTVQTKDLGSGKDIAKEKRKEMVERIEMVEKKIAETQQIIMDIIRLRNGNLPELKLFIGSWNVGNALPDAEELKKLLPVGGGGNDIVSVGLQECEFELTADMRSVADEARERFKHDRHAMKEISALQNIEELNEKQNANSNNNSNASSSNKKRVSEMATLDKKQYTSVSKVMEKTAKRAITSKAGLYIASLIAGILGPDYYLIRDCELMQMRQFVFAKSEHIPRITNIEFGSEATGIASVVGNKGGLFVAFEFQGVRLCFTSCHLAAHEAHKYLIHRNENCDEILNSSLLYIGRKYFPYFVDWDYIFFFGDLNYRLDPHIDGFKLHFNSLLSKESDVDDSDDEIFDFVNPSYSRKDQDSPKRSMIPHPHGGILAKKGKKEKTVKPVQKQEKQWPERERVLESVKKRDWEYLVKIDQLKKEIKDGRALWGFEEGVIKFDPTFKVARGTALHDYNDKRIPSYCDRILWCKAPSRRYERSVVQTMFESVPAVTTSDHKPVHASFVLDLQPVLEKLIPLPPGEQDEGLVLRITDLEARNLEPADTNGLADPYVIFHSNVLFSPGTDGANPLKGATRTRVLTRRLNAKWHDCSYVMQCATSIMTPKDLRKRHLLLSIWDRDTLTADDVMGNALIQFDKIFDLQKEAKNGKEIWGKSFHFSEPIVHGSHIAGTVSGRIECLHPTSKASTFEPAEGCCVLL